MKITSIKLKLFFIILGVSLVSLVVLCAVSFWSLLSIREQVQKSSADLGEFAAATSSRFLQREVLNRLMAQARDQSLIINERLLDIAKDTLLLSNFVKEIYIHSSELPAIPIPYSRSENRGTLTMQLRSANGRADYMRLRSEANLLGNIKSLFESNKHSMQYMTISVFLGTESGLFISYDPFSDDTSQVFDPRVRPWYIGAKSAQNIYWTAPYIGAVSGELFITCSMPFYNANNVFMGVAGIDVILSDLYSEITNIVNNDLGVSGFAFIIDSERTLVSSSNINYSDAVFNEIKKEVALGASGFRRIIVEEDEMLIAYSPIQTTGWSLATVRPVSQIMNMVTENYAVIDNMTLRTRDFINSIIMFTSIIFILVSIAVAAAIAIFSSKLSAKIALPIDSLEAELNVAASIQSNMLPSSFPAFPYKTEFDIYASMLPARIVGGDFYDFFMIDSNTLALVMADVSGKGIPSALFMVVAKTLIKYNAQSGKSPQDVFINVNNLLCENNDACMFVTAFMGFLNIPTGKFTYVSAGHNPPLIKRANGEFEWLPVRPELILAGMEDTQYKQDEITLNKNDILFLYTDGVTEAFNNKGELFTDARLLKTVNKCANADLKDFLHDIKKDIDAFANGAEQADDITMLALDYKGYISFIAKEITVEAKIENLDSVMDFIGVEMEKKNINMELQNNIKVAVEEVFVNISSYAYTPLTGNVTVKMDMGSEIIIQFKDSGTRFNPLEMDDPNIITPIEERDIGGLGIFMIKKLMDTVDYLYENGNNILTIKKRI
ncbi:MAG: SpoIIE family protein phosphatase [Treponema sp.]|jgi:sigma-B regulation protein RsbU (phosphoserine phosphatase)|nr:SpoIIE family protein phosphatase [Treponema sp.]